MLGAFLVTVFTSLFLDPVEVRFTIKQQVKHYVIVNDLGIVDYQK